jgi:DNA-binding transcriptional LysR family regulator
MNASIGIIKLTIVNLIYIKTFLEIAVTRNFYQASKNLNIAQSTASVRINILEQALGHQLFMRSRSGFEITAAGTQFQKHALNMMRSWEQAQQSIGLVDGTQSLYRICVQINLWEQLINNWIPWIMHKDPNAILDLESDFSGVMMSQLSDGLLDIGVMYSPRKVQGLKSEQLLEEDLVMVSTHARNLDEVDLKNYVLVKWGRAFLHMHGQTFPQFSQPIISVGLGPIALRHILTRGGSCYQSRRIVQQLIDQQALFIVEDAPVYPRPVYMVYPDDASEIERLQLALEGLREVAGLIED